jgi:DNA polymerase-3 subunit beta
MAKGKKPSGDGLIAKVDAAEFARRLGYINGSLPRRNQIPILNCILLSAEDARVSLTATNLDQQSEADVTAEVTAAGSVCVEGARLATVVARMTGELLLTLDEGKLKLTAGRARAELPVLPAGDFASLKGPEGGETFEIASGVLGAGFGSVMHAASNEDTRYYLRGVFVERKSAALIFTATDGHRLASLEITSGIPAEADFEAFIVPREVLRDYCKFCERADGPVAMTVSDGRLQLSAHGETHITKLIDGTYPAYERVIPKQSGARICVPLSELKAAVGIAMTGTEDRSRAVRFAAEEGRLHCLSRQEAALSEAVIEATDIEPCEPFGLNAKYVLEALEACRGDSVELVVVDSATPVRFETGDALRQCIMTLRV